MEKQKKQDSIFRSIFKDKVRLLELCNAFVKTDYRDPDEIYIIDTDYAPELRVRNEIAFIIDNILFIIEHQLDVDVNTPLRLFLYYGHILQEITDGKLNAKFGKHALRIAATAQLYVLYCGEKDYPKEGILKISDLFIKHDNVDVHSGLIVNVPVLNINTGCNPKLERRSKILAAYARFIAKARKYLVQVPIIDVDKDGKYDDVMKDYLVPNTKELMDMLDEEFKMEKES